MDNRQALLLLQESQQGTPEQKRTGAMARFEAIRLQVKGLVRAGQKMFRTKVWALNEAECIDAVLSVASQANELFTGRGYEHAIFLHLLKRHMSRLHIEIETSKRLHSKYCTAMQAFSKPQTQALPLQTTSPQVIPPNYKVDQPVAAVTVEPKPFAWSIQNGTSLSY